MSAMCQRRCLNAGAAARTGTVYSRPSTGALWILSSNSMNNVSGIDVTMKNGSDEKVRAE